MQTKTITFEIPEDMNEKFLKQLIVLRVEQFLRNKIQKDITAEIKTDLDAIKVANDIPLTPVKPISPLDPIIP